MNNTKKIINAVISVSIISIISKILGFIREMFIAYYYGATAETDAFFFAQEMPKLIFPTIGDSVAIVFISLFASKISIDRKESDYYASGLINSMLIVSFFMSTFGIIFSGFFVKLFAIGFTEYQISISAKLSKIAMFGFLLNSIQYMFGGVLNVKKKFVKSSIIGLFYNLIIILLTIFFGNYKDVNILMITVLIALFIQTMITFLFSKKEFHYNILSKPFASDSKKMFKLSIPILLGNCVWQINNIVDKSLASTQKYGALSSISYANSINNIFVAICVSSLSTVLFPILSQESGNNNKNEFNRIFIESLKYLTTFLLPIICVVIFSHKDIVSVIYKRGNFGSNALEYTSIVLLCYAPRVLFIGIREIITRAFFSHKNTKTPAINSIIGVLLNIVFSLIFIRILGLAGIAIGTTISEVTSSIFMIISAKKFFRGLKFSEFFRHFMIIIFAAIISIFNMFIFSKFKLNINSFFNVIYYALIGFISYFFIILIFYKKLILKISSV